MHVADFGKWSAVHNHRMWGLQRHPDLCIHHTHYIGRPNQHLLPGWLKVVQVVQVGRISRIISVLTLYKVRGYKAMVIVSVDPVTALPITTRWRDEWDEGFDPAIAI